MNPAVFGHKRNRTGRQSAWRWASIWLLLVSFYGSVSAAPFSDLVDSEGNPANLDSVIGQGKWTLVMFWATDCYICTKQKPEISAFHDAHKDSDATVVGIAIDGTNRLKAVNKYLAKHKPTFPNYAGDYAVVGLNYEMLTEEKLRGTPTYLLFNPEGELKGNNPGPLSINALTKFMAKHTP